VTVAPQVSPEQLLGQAQALCDGLNDASASYWARAAAFLARMALEEAITAMVTPLDPALCDATMASKLLLLHARADDDTVRAAQRAWAGLSRTCHHHPYELAPTRSELVDLIGAVRHVMHVAHGAPSLDQRATPHHPS
jgi:hypothetical protein